MTTPFTTSSNNPVEQQESVALSMSNGDLNFTEEGKYDREDDFPYTDYVIKNSYEWDRHIYMAGVTSPEGFGGATASFFQLSNPTLIWICSWTACKWGVQPEYPDPTPNDTDWVLLDIIPQTTDPGLSPDGDTVLYRLSGIYVYGNVKAGNQPFSKISFPKPPWLKDDFSRTVPTSKQRKNISTPIGSQGAPPGTLTNPVIR